MTTFTKRSTLDGGHITKLARAMSTNYDVNVLLTGTSCSTNGNTIKIPANSDEIKGVDARILAGMLDHEVQHVVEEQLAKANKTKSPIEHIKEMSKRGARWAMMLNVYEDIRIEAKASAKYTGVGENLTMLAQHTVEKFTKGQGAGSATNNPWHTLGCAIIMEARGLSASAWAPKKVMALVEQLRPEINDSRKAQSIDDVVALVERTMAKVKDFAEQPPAPLGPHPKGTGKPQEQEEDGEQGEQSQQAGSQDDNEEQQGGEDGGEAGEERDDSEGGSEDSEGSSAEGEDADGSEDGPADSEDAEDGEDGDDAHGSEDDSEGSEEAEDGEANEDGDAEDAKDGGAEDGDGEDGDNEDGDNEDGEDGDSSQTGAPGEKNDEDVKEASEAAKELMGQDAKTTDLTDAVRNEITKASEEDAQANKRWIAHPLMALLDRWDTPDVDQYKAEYSRARDAATAIVSTMKSKMVSVLRVRSQSCLAGDQERGTIDSGALHSLKMGNKRVFAQKAQAQTLSTAVSIAVDMSGSMSSKNKSAHARTMAIAMGEALAALNVPFEIIGYTNNDASLFGWKGAMMAPDENIARVQPFLFTVFKTFGETYKRVCGRLGGIRAIGNNFDGEAITHIARRLHARRETRKVLFVITDGTHSCYKEREEAALRDAVRLITSSGVEVHGIGVCCDDVAKHYNAANGADNINVNDPALLPAEAFKMLKRSMVDGPVARRGGAL